MTDTSTPSADPVGDALKEQHKENLASVTNITNRRTTKRPDVQPIPKGSTGTKAKATKPAAPSVTKGRPAKSVAKVAKTNQQAAAKARASKAAKSTKAKAPAKVSTIVRKPSVVSKDGEAKCDVCRKQLPLTKFPTIRVNGVQERDTRRCRGCRDAGKPMPGGKAKAVKAPAKPKASKTPAKRTTKPAAKRVRKAPPTKGAARTK